MTNITIESLATEIQISINCLIKQFANIGIIKSTDDSVTIQERQTLLEYLNSKHTTITTDKLTLQRKTRSILNISRTDGKNKLVQVEVRKLRTFIKQNMQENELPCLKIQEKNSLKKQQHHEFIEKAQYSTTEKIESTDHQNIDIIKNSETEKICCKNKITQLKHELKGKLPNHKFEKSAYILTTEIQSIDIKNKRINNSNKLVKNTNNNYIDTSSKSYQFDNKNKHEVKNIRRHTRNIKSLRSIKKTNKYLGIKVDHIDREEYHATIRSNKINKYKNNNLKQHFQKPNQIINREVIIGENITVGELANKMAIKSSQVIKVMLKMGVIANINQTIDQETAQLVVEEMGHKVILHHENELEKLVMKDRDTDIVTEQRAPVVTIMGHVDHGKTSLLDCIRSTKVASNEIGGITQRIGAYHVKTENGKITFLDTPGHAAFTAMRIRGVQITDIVVLVIAADDGVMPQTVEAIHHARAACVPIVVAINKIDKPDAKPEHIKNELANYGITPEQWGGDYQFVYVSAKTGIGIDELLNAIILQAEIMELKAVHKGMASGAVIESSLDKGRGPVATVLICEGTLNKGDVVLCGLEYGRIRAMYNEFGHEVLEAKPSIPVEILGLSGVPIAGDKVTVVRNEKKAREVALYRQNKFREVKLAYQQKHKLENIFNDTIKGEKIHELNIVLKADVQGAIEAISDSLLKLSNDKIKIKIISSGVGGITETDATLAVASNAILIGFNVRADASARKIIDTENLCPRYYSVIYNLIDEIKAAMNGILSPESKQQIIGLAEVRNIFRSPKLGYIAGCIVTNGVIKRHSPIRVLRNNIIVYEGELESLRRFKDDVNEIRNGVECGIGIKNYKDVHIGDIIEVFELIKV